MELDFQTLSLPLVAGIFFAAAIAITLGGWRLSNLADRLADRTGMGEAITGAVFLGAVTSQPGIVTSVTAAWQGHPELAVSNAIGSIAVQTLFLAIADLLYKRANLEHAAASLSNLMQSVLLIIMLSMPLAAATMPDFSIWSVSPATPLMLVFYIYGLHIISQSRSSPMWHPRLTAETRRDMPDSGAQQEKLHRLALGIAVIAVIVGVSGWLVARTGITISRQTGLSESAVGVFLTAVVTSLPELVTTIAAVRQGAYTLAIGGIIGGNAFDTLFAAVADIAYRDGSIYHAISNRQVFFITLTMLMTAILLLGMLRRQKRGIANIGFESFLIIVLYGSAAAYIFFG
jgi:cation:H+ antiporter